MLPLPSAPLKPIDNRSSHSSSVGAIFYFEGRKYVISTILTVTFHLGRSREAVGSLFQIVVLPEGLPVVLPAFFLKHEMRLTSRWVRFRYLGLDVTHPRRRSDMT